MGVLPVLAGSTAALVLTVGLCPAAGADEGPTDSYVMTLAPTARVRDVVTPAEVKENLTGAAFRGALLGLTAAEAAELRQRPGVVAVELEPVLTLAKDVQQASVAQSWGLDRIDQAALPLDGNYTPPATGAGIDVYIVDSGLNANGEFAGRVGDGWYHPSVGADTSDCNGHGTHVAGTVASSLFGVAPGVTVHPVRVADCSQATTGPIVISALNWVAANAPTRSVVNLSLGGITNTAVNTAVAALTARGLVVTTSAGNSGQNACYYSPANEPSVLTVGAVDIEDRMASFSNWGPCLDLFAPGVGIRSTNGYSGELRSGTSMASPHVAGAAALYWEIHPEASGAAVREAVVAQATGSVVFPWDPRGSPTKALNVQWQGAGLPSAPTAVTGQGQNGAVKVSWQPPASDGGSPVTGYTVVQPFGKTGCSTGPTASCVVPGLTNGKSYIFAVYATNARGTGTMSLWSAAVVPVSAPSAPREVMVGVRRGRAKVSWNAPRWDGGSVITKYTAVATSGRRCSVAAWEGSPFTMSCTVRQLKHGKKVRFTVTAYNAVGASPGTLSRKVRIK